VNEIDAFFCKNKKVASSQHRETHKGGILALDPRAGVAVEATVL